MKSIFLYLLIILLNLNLHSQHTNDSIIGTYQYENWMGGGFAGDGAGNCYALPPDATIEHLLILKADGSVTKSMDTINYNSATLFSCLDIYHGTYQQIGDSIYVSYQYRNPCQFFFRLVTDSTETQDTIVALETTLHETYYIRRERGEFIVLILRDNGVTWEENYYILEEE